MAEKLGEIYYEVDLETSQLIEANQKVRKELDGMGDQAKGAAAGLKTLEAQMKSSATAVNRATTAGSGFRSTFQQAGYQIQDFIVQVQGGQSALVAFSQQGSQLAGAFGPGGAMVGALIALGSVLTGVLMSALGNTSNEMDKLGKAADTLNKIVVINSQGVAALSNDYARLAVTNATLAAQLRDNAIANYEVAVRDAGKAIQGIVKEQSSWFGSLQGGSASVSALGGVLSTLNIETNSFREAFSEASKTGLGANTMANTLTATVSMLGDQFSIGDDAAFGLAKRLNDVAKNPSPQAISSLVDYMNSLNPATKDGAEAMVELETKVLAAGAAMQKAQDDSEALKNRLKELRTEAQQANFDSVSKQLEAQRISLTQGALAAKIYAINNMDLTQSQKDQLIASLKVVDQTEKDKKAKDEAAAAAKRQGDAQSRSSEQIAQKLETLRQKSELASSSTESLNRQQAILQAQQSLGKGATQEQIKLAGEYAAKAYDTAAALKAQAAAEKLLPETRENASYKQDMEDLQTALAAKKISQEQYNSTSEQLEQQHQANLAKIRSQQAVSPQQQAVGTVDPVQQLANENAQKLALIQQFEKQKLITEQQGLELRNAANTEYEQARIAAQWEIYKAQSDSNALLASTIESLSGGATNAITGLLNGTQSLSEAFANLGTAVINGVVSSLVQMGTQWVMSAVMGQTAQTAAIAANQASATAALAASTIAGTAAAGTLLASWSPAAMAASIASYGGAATAGLAGYTAAMASAQTMSIAGMREHGGPVTANSMYRVGEGGKPEIFKASNGSQYMIPGDNGSVISNHDIGSGGGGQVVHQTIQVNGNPDDRTLLLIQQAAQQGAKQGYQMVVGDLAKGTGNASKALKSSFNTRSKIK